MSDARMTETDVCRAVMHARALAAEGLRGELQLRDEHGHELRIEIEDRNDWADPGVTSFWSMHVSAHGYDGEELARMGDVIDEGERMLRSLCLP
jgi:hypothetical protein